MHLGLTEPQSPSTLTDGAKLLLYKSEDLSSNPRTHAKVGREELTSQSCPPISTYMQMHTEHTTVTTSKYLQSIESQYL